MSSKKWKRIHLYSTIYHILCKSIPFKKFIFFINIVFIVKGRLFYNKSKRQ